MLYDENRSRSGLSPSPIWENRGGDISFVFGFAANNKEARGHPQDQSCGPTRINAVL